MKAAMSGPDRSWFNRDRVVVLARETQRATFLNPSLASRGAIPDNTLMVARRISLTLGFTLFFVPLTASAGLGDLKGTQPGELPFGGKFQDADDCALCHGGGIAGNTYSLPFDTWAGTMMANAARDPVFFAALAVANQDMPGVGSFCIRCHTPLAFVRGHAAADGSQLDAVDLQGIGCETCHRAVQSPLPEGPYLLGDAQLVFDGDVAKRGPYADASSPAHPSLKDAGLGDSRFCGQCHQVTNPERKLRNASGVETALAFPLDTTYEEWALSDYAIKGSPSFQSCADCHLKRMSNDFPVAVTINAPLRNKPRVHQLAGGNYWGIQAVMAQYPERVAAFPNAFKNALIATKDTLFRSVAVSLQGVPEQVKPGESFGVSIRVENISGHKFPTGYAESRRAWVSVAMVDHHGTEMVLVGGYDAQTGEIQADPKPRVYQARHGQWNGAAFEAEEHLVLHDGVVMDSRIPPRGFLGSAGTLPVGEVDYGSGAGAYRHFDEVSYTVAVPASLEGHVRVIARVYYQSMTREYVTFLRDANTTTSHGESLMALYEATEAAAPMEIAVAELSTEVGEALDAGVDGGGGAGAGADMKDGGSGGGCDCRVKGARDGWPGYWVGVTVALAWIGRRRSRIDQRGGAFRISHRRAPGMTQRPSAMRTQV